MSYFAFDYLLQKFLNNRNLAVFISITFVTLLICAYQLYVIHLQKFHEFKLIALFSFLFGVMQFWHVQPVFFLPDAILFIVGIWGLLYLRQDISAPIWLSAVLLVYFLCFSRPHLDIEFDNRYLTSIKPFIYLIILYVVSACKMPWDLKPLVYGTVVAYPLLLLCNIGLWWWRDGFFMNRPNYIFENNFEVPWLLSCFIVIAFIYRNRDFRVYLLTAIGVLLTGSRSGLASFLVASLFYLATLGWKKLGVALLPIAAALAYMIFIRGSSSFNALDINKIDRLQTFLGIFAFYDFNIMEVLRYPLGVGLYQKIPLDICNKIEGYADWFTGNYFNCDPLMLQSFVARALYQFGIYVLLFIPLAYFFELRKRMGAYLSCVVLIPMVCASFSVGGFSNGIAFGGLLLCLFAFQQNKSSASDNSKLPLANGHSPSLAT